MFCPYCGSNQLDGATFCHNCANALPSIDEKKTVGSPIGFNGQVGYQPIRYPAGNAFPQGYPQPANLSNAPGIYNQGQFPPSAFDPQGMPKKHSRTKYISALLAFLLGGFGAHKFYLGEIGLGILYLLFFWSGIPSLVAFVECFLYLTMDDKIFDKKYNY